MVHGGLIYLSPGHTSPAANISFRALLHSRVFLLQVMQQVCFHLEQEEFSCCLLDVVEMTPFFDNKLNLRLTHDMPRLVSGYTGGKCIWLL